MAHLFRMPAVLANSTEAVFQTWLIKQGQEFAVGDEIAEIETEKALVDLVAEEAGILGRQLVLDGQSVSVGMAIAVIVAEDETDADIDAVLSAGQESAAEPSAEPDELLPATPAAPPIAAASVDSERLFVSPLVRRLARENGVDPSLITGTGPNGRVVRRDLDAWLASAPRTAAATTEAITPATPSTLDGYEDIPHTPMRRAIAGRLTESKSTVPHFYLTTACRVDRLLALRAEINTAKAPKISINDLILKAVASAFVRVPEANVIWTDDALRKFGTVDISVAVSTDRGLVTPVARDVASLSLTQLSATVGDLVSRARIGRLRQEELEGGSFSISNLGMYGTAEFTAILNPPQSGILAIGATKEEVVVADGEAVVATVMRCTLSVDHRAVDGALAAQWLDAFTTIIENPVTMLV